LSKGIFEDDTRMHPRARNVQQNGYKAITPLYHFKQEQEKLDQIISSLTVAVQAMWPYQ